MSLTVANRTSNRSPDRELPSRIFDSTGSLTTQQLHLGGEYSGHQLEAVMVCW